jgi:predicted nucleotidyltransferase
MVVTVAERKQRKVEQLRAAARDAMAELSAYARLHGGRFLVFGSVARNEIVPNSDFDVIVAFPLEEENSAYEAAESIATSHGLKPDVLLLSHVSPALMMRVERDAIVLQ